MLTRQALRRKVALIKSPDSIRMSRRVVEAILAAKTTCRPASTATETPGNTLPWHLAIPCGMAGGTIQALTGVAHNAIVVPFLGQLTRMTPHQVLGTASLAVTLSTTAGGMGYFNLGFGDIGTALPIAAAGVISGKFGAVSTGYLSARYLGLLLAGSLLVVSPVLAMQPRKPKKEVDRMPNTADMTRGDTLPSTGGAIALGVACGFIQGLTGLGGGMLMVMWLTGMSGMQQRDAVATCLMASPFSNGAAAYGHWKLGNIHGKASLMVGAASVVSSLAATQLLAPYTNDEMLRGIFCIVAFASGVKMWRSHF